MWEVWGDVVGGGEGEGDTGGDGASRVLYVEEDGVFVGGEEEWKEAGVGRQLARGSGEGGSEEGGDCGIVEGEEEDSGEKGDGEDEDEDVRGEK